MIVYVFWKNNLQIIAKIDNIEYISDSDKEIRGNSIIKYGDSQDYICLETDTVDLNINDVINLNGLIDHRKYFTNGKDYWYQEQIKKSNETITNLNEMSEIYGSTLDYLMFNVLPSLVTTESSSNS